MENNSNEESLLYSDSTRSKPSSHVRLYILLAAALLLGVATIYFFWTKGNEAQITEQAPVVQQKDESAPSGTIYMSLTTMSTTTGSRNMLSSIYDIESKTPYRIPVNSLADKAALTFQYSLSQDGGWVTFLGLTKTEIADELNFASWSVLKTDLYLTTGSAPMLEAIESSSTAYVPDAQDYFREFPVINNDGSILYSSLSKETFESSKGKLENLKADDWSIYQVDSEGLVAKITDGLRPKWIDASSFAYLKNDGMYVFDLETGEEILVMSSEAELTIVNGFDVSDDGQLLVLTSPAEETVAVLDLSSWLTDATTKPHVVSAIASNPLFSPGNKYLALVMPEKGVSGERESKLRYYSLVSNKFLEISDNFNPETIDGIYLTDWRN